MANQSNPQYHWQDTFAEIASFNDQDVPDALRAVLQDQTLTRIVGHLFQQLGSTNQNALAPLKQLASLTKIADLQDWIETHIFPTIAASYSSLEISGLEELDPNTPYIFISNHRDIVMDPLLLNLALRRAGFDTAHCAIGDNLLLSPTADRLARLNHCFKVVRSLTSPKAILRAMKTQSAYIAYQHYTQRNHIWVAQKEGRSKDNRDATNPALIKMLGLTRSKEQDPVEFYEHLNIVPVCYSYEWDPCDTHKALQLESASSSSDYEKSAEEDLEAVKLGLLEHKGQISLRFGSPIKPRGGKAVHLDIAEQIDTFIRSNYTIYPVNRYARWLLTGEENRPKGFEPADEQTIKQLDDRLKGQTNSVRNRVLHAYAAPFGDESETT